jgi:hypothetical protein
METVALLQKELHNLEAKIRELKDRLPAHSAKPGMLQELMDLEDERDLLLSRIASMNDQNS